jgi:Cse1
VPQCFEPGPHAAQAKDCAVYLVMALAGRTRTAAAGAKAVNELVNVADFFRTQVAPDIQSTDANLVRTFTSASASDGQVALCCTASLTHLCMSNACL